MLGEPKLWGLPPAPAPKSNDRVAVLADVAACRAAGEAHPWSQQSGYGTGWDEPPEA